MGTMDKSASVSGCRLSRGVDILPAGAEHLYSGMFTELDQTGVVLSIHQPFAKRSKANLRFHFASGDGRKTVETLAAILSWQSGHSVRFDFVPALSPASSAASLVDYVFKRHVQVSQPKTEVLPDPPTPKAQTVLLVEDEDGQRMVFRKTLEKCGYKVLDARFNSEAFIVYKRNADSIQLIVTDVMMPGINGPEFVAPLRSSRPELRIVYMSSSPHSDLIRYRILNEGMPFLQKPFTPKNLTSKVREVLSHA